MGKASEKASERNSRCTSNVTSPEPQLHGSGELAWQLRLYLSDAGDRVRHLEVATSDAGFITVFLC